MSDGDALADDLKRIRKGRRTARREKYRRSRLDRYRSQVEALEADGASTEEIRIWLRQNAHVKVARSTVWRALARWKKKGG